MNLRCYFCGHTIPLARGLDSFEGSMRCRVCRKVMTVRLQSGYLRSMTPGTPEPVPAGVLRPVRTLRHLPADLPMADAGRHSQRQGPTEAVA